MNKNHFIISYFGNKRQEVERIYEEIKDNIKNVKYIIEPFCGSSALSYYISLKHPKKYTYILNDNNKFLIELYEIMKDDDKLNKLIEFLNNNMNITKEEYKKIQMNENVYNWIFKNKFYQIRPNIFPFDKKSDNFFNNMKKSPIIEFLRNEKIILSNKSGLDIYKEYVNNNKAFIFLDPPYLDSCNDFYFDSDTNIYEYLSHNDITKEKAKITLCLENTWIIKLLFKNTKKVFEYDKLYQTTKKKTKHIIITNM